MGPEARALYEEGLGLYAARDFTGAIRRFEEGYALDPRREFLFAEAQAFRLAGDCPRAVALYQRFLQTEPSPLHIDATRMGLDRCAKQAAATPAPAPAEAARARPEPPPSDSPRPPPDRPRWWLDPVGLVAAGAGVAALGVGVGFVIAAHDAQDQANRVNSRSTPIKAEYDRLYALAERRLTIGVVALTGGAAALVGGLARLAFVRHRQHAAEGGASTLVTIAPAANGATLVWQGRF